MSRKPVIGITPTPAEHTAPHGTFHRFTLADTYTTAVEAAGGIPLIIPPQDGNIDAILDVLDGLIISGGGDIDPARYGDSTVHETTDGLDEGRDNLELALAERAIERDMPMLCICRGIQILNVALGGTLYQDVADQFSDELQHRQQENNIPKHDPGHSVSVEPDSLMAQTYGQPTVEVNSFHHQSLKDVAPDLKVSAVAPDGTIEGVEHSGKSWVLGVQWHPEMMYAAHEEHLRPFSALVKASSRVPATT